MPKPPQPRNGKPYVTRGRKKIVYSFWPTVDNFQPGRKAIQDRLYSNDPWSVIKNAVVTRIDDAKKKAEVNNYVKQAKEFFDAANTKGVEGAKPLLTYYCAMNLTKALLLMVTGATTLDNAKHGLIESNLRATPIDDHIVTSWRKVAGTVNIFTDFKEYLTGTPILVNENYRVKSLFAQILLGHRLYTQVEGIYERFIQIRDIEYIIGEGVNEVWLRLYFDPQDFLRRNLSRQSFLTQTNLIGRFSEVQNPNTDKKWVCFEQITPRAHGGWPTDSLKALSQSIKNDCWSVPLTSKPYTRYYFYLRTPGEIVLPQILSIYATTFYLGSVTRYRPSHFQELISTKYGGFIGEFVNHQIVQFLYIMASEFAKNDVSKPSVV